MNWQNLGGTLVKAGAPIIGRTLGGPLGGMMGEAIGGVLADALGVEPTPDAVDDAIKKTPTDALGAKLSAAEAEAQAKWPALAEIAKADAEAAARTLSDTQVTMRAEAASGNLVQRYWRPAYAFELTIECAVVWVIVFHDLLFGAQKLANFIPAISGLLTVYWGARFAVLGVYVQGRTREKEATITGQIAPSIIDQIVKAVRKR